MAKYVSIHPRRRNKILRRTMYSGMKYNTIFGLLILIGFIVIPFLRKSKSNISFSYLNYYVIVICSIVGLWFLLYLLDRLASFSYLKNLNRKVAWNYIDIQSSRIYMKMSWEEFYIERDTIDEIGFASEDEKRFMINENWIERVPLKVLKIATKDAYLYIVPEIIHDSDAMLLELHDFLYIEGYEGEREKELNNLIEKLYKELLCIEENIRNNGFTESEGIIEEFNKIISASDNDTQEILTLSNKIEKIYVGDRIGLKCIQNKLQSLYNEQKRGYKKLSIVFWNEILKIIFKGHDTTAKVWGMLIVLEEQKLHFNKMYYVRLLETYGIGPLTVTEIAVPEMEEYRFELYRHTVVLLNADTAQQVVYSIIYNVYERLMHGNIENKEVYDNYIKIIKKYVIMPEEMLNMIPEYDPGKYSETKEEVEAFFMELFEKLPKTNWSTAKCRFSMNSKQLSPKTEDLLISKTKALM